MTSSPSNIATKNMQRQNAKSKAIALEFRGVSKLSFVDHTYTATLYLMEGSELKIGVSFMVEVEVLYEDCTLAKGRVLQLESKDFVIGKQSPHLELSYQFKESSMLHDNRKFRLRVRPKVKFPAFLPAVTEPISVIKYKLNVTSELPKRFYKNQGGRDKSMQLKVQLEDGQGKCVFLQRRMPLAILLCYEKGLQPVPNQAEILNLMGRSTPHIETNGVAEICFRIEEVSSLHQRNKFVLCIMPDVERCPLNGNVLKAYSSAVKILSKPAGASTRKRARKMQHLQPGISPQIGKCMEDALTASKRPRVDPSDPAQAIDDMVKWSTYTCDVLRSIQRQPIGYELNSDGSPNTDLKIYRCPSCYQSSTGQQNNHAPDCALNRILTMYTECVGPGIADILRCKKDDEEFADRVFESKLNDEPVIGLQDTYHHHAIPPSLVDDKNFNDIVEEQIFDARASPDPTASPVPFSPLPLSLSDTHLDGSFSSLISPLGVSELEDSLSILEIE